MPDKYKATWVSYSSISDWQKCPRAYFLKNVYKDSTTGNKITLMKPALALGRAVHETLEGLLDLPKEERLQQDLEQIFNKEWKQVSGEQGGFNSKEQEEKYKKRGLDMLSHVKKNPGPITNLAIKIKDGLPNFWLDKDEEIILCGRVDWLEYLPDKESVHIIDFKTGKNREEQESLQLPIYLLLASECQSWDIDKASYWYLQDEEIEQQNLPDRFEAREEVLDVAKEIKNARTEKNFECPSNGCFHCQPYEKIISGEAEMVGVNEEFNKDVYILPD
jgi:ATP-dependent helicase/DNAse subunit B